MPWPLKRRSKTTSWRTCEPKLQECQRLVVAVLLLKVSQKKLQLKLPEALKPRRQDF